MLNQAFSDRAKLSKLLNISDEQMSYVTNADAGCGLLPVPLFDPLVDPLLDPLIEPPLAQPAAARPSRWR